MSKVQVHVDGVRAMGRRFADAWHRAARGEDMRETHVTFLDLESLQAALSPRRLELLRHVRQHGASSVRGLAAALDRDYKNVHQDVAALELAGLLVRDGRKLTAPWDEVQASVALAAT
jgi:predicted transcriptional regulator